MLFSGIPFLYYFLPVVLALYFLLPKRWRNGTLLFSSLVFYAWGEPNYVFLMVGTIMFYYGMGLAMGRWPGAGRWFLWLSVLTAVALFGVFKYAGLFGAPWSLPLPIGISFYLFQTLSYVIDVYRGDATPQRNLVEFGTYVAMFPQLIAGPIVRYVEVEPQLRCRTVSREDLFVGFRRFLVGLGKKVLLANLLGAFCTAYQTAAAPSVGFAWLSALAYTLQIYFDFSGYSDMAIGLGRILGFRFPENFDYPYLSASLTEFWRRWHQTLGRWFRDYVYIPLGGNRCSRLKWVRNLLVVWTLTGLWHGASWTFVLWGLGFGVLLGVEKLLPGLRKLGRFYVIPVVILSFVLFGSGSVAQAGTEFARLFGRGGLPLLTGETVYYLKSNLVLLALGMLGATPFPKKLWQRWQDSAAMTVLEPLALLGILLVSTAYLVDGSFNPFLYFRF